MKKTTNWLLTLILTLFLAVLAACGETTGEENTLDDSATKEVGKEDNTITIEDDIGNTVVIEQPVESIVSLSPSNTEILYALGLGDKVIGVTSFCNYPEEAQEKTIVSDSVTVDVETVLSLEPDLVLGYTIGDAEQLDPFIDEGIPVLVIASAVGIDDVYEDIDLIGKATGQEEEANDLIQEMKEKQEYLIERANEIEESKKVYFEISPAPDLWTAGKGTFQGEFLDVIGAENVFSDVEGWSSINDEDVVARAPEVIITSATYEEDAIGDIKNRDSWETIPAVENDEIYLVDDELVSRPGPRIIDGLEEVLYAVYPELAE